MFHIAQYFPITDPTLIFFVVLLIILFAPIIMGKLRIPHIIGMVLAGVLIGKYGLNTWSATLRLSSSERWDSITSCSSLPWRWIWKV
mgnify:CR=1 FL=1